MPWARQSALKQGNPAIRQYWLVSWIGLTDVETRYVYIHKRIAFFFIYETQGYREMMLFAGFPSMVQYAI